MLGGYIELKIFLLKNSDVAKILGIKKSAFSKKINRKNKSDFSLDEVRKICEYYKISSDEYFFIK